MAQEELESTHSAPGKAESRHRKFFSAFFLRGKRGLGAESLWVGIASLLGVFVLLVPITRSGIWDPVELRVADMAVKVASTLFHASLGVADAARSTLPTIGELGRGELPYTSIALGFRLFGLHDWAGRLPLGIWMCTALIAIVVWVHRFVGYRAAVWAALTFPTLPLVFFQARFMLGDATTIGSLTLCFVSLSLSCIDTSNEIVSSLKSRLIWLAVALIAAALGVISRGVLIGVAVPFIAVGLAGLPLAIRTAAGHKRRRADLTLSIGAFAIGLAALVVGVWVATTTSPSRGAILMFQGSNLQSNFHPHSFDSVISQLGHGLFPWSGFLLFAVAAVFGRRQRFAASGVNGRALCALLLFVFAAAAAQTWMGSFGVLLPFPAIAALVAILAIGLDTVSRDSASPRLVALGTVAFLVVLFGDFENTPDKILAATASVDAHIPASFRNGSFQWIRGCSVAIAAASVVLGFGFGEHTREFLCRDEIGAFTKRAKVFWNSQWGFYILLVETALVTGAMLLLATRFGVPLQRLRDLGSPQRELLAWSWLALPALATGFVITRFALAALDLLFSSGFGLPQLEASHGLPGRFAGRVLHRYPAVRAVTPKRNFIWAVCLLMSAAVFSIGWGAKLGEQLSPRRALSRFESLSKPGEALGLLGVRPQIVQYYSRQRPELLLDPDEAADWLSHSKGDTRWMIVKGDQLPRLNGAFRERCQCLQNLPIVDSRSSDMLLAANRPIDGVTEKNPYDDILLDHVPKPRQPLSADLGGQVEVLGWELLTLGGKSVAELQMGHTYELRLFYRVLSRPTIDWETFVHIDGYGRRFNGDHDTNQGRYPATNWRPGDIVVDISTIALDPGFSHGNYELYFGLFKGTRRLEVKRGRQDENRLIAGTIRVR